MADTEQLEHAILERLSEVIDPEIGLDVVRMCLLEDLTVSQEGEVTYTFRPSSYFCPVAVSLSMAILSAVAEVKGISRQKVTVVDYIQADVLNKLLNEVQDNKYGA